MKQRNARPHIQTSCNSTLRQDLEFRAVRCKALGLSPLGDKPTVEDEGDLDEEDRDEGLG